MLPSRGAEESEVFVAPGCGERVLGSVLDSPEVRYFDPGEGGQFGWRRKVPNTNVVVNIDRYDRFVAGGYLREKP